MRHVILYMIFLVSTQAFAEDFFFEAGEHSLKCECVGSGKGQDACRLFGTSGTDIYKWTRKINIPRNDNYDISFLTEACFRDALKAKGDEGASILCCIPESNSYQDISKFYRAKP